MDVPSIPTVLADGAGGITVSLALQLAMAFLGGLIVPIILHLVKRSRESADKLQGKAETAQDALQKQNFAALEKQVEELVEATKEDRRESKELQKLMTAFQREFDQRLSSCQKVFVSAESYRREIVAQRQYLRFIIGFMKNQADDITRGIPDGDE